jgi:outer membrane protein assembly factor BamB
MARGYGITQVSNKYVLAALLLVALAACTGPPVKIGSTKLGDREAVMPAPTTVEVDKSLAGTKPKLPPETSNADWPQDGYASSHMLPNAKLADEPEEIWNEDIGDGSNSDYKLLARPVVAEGRVFVMDAHGLVSSFDANTGHQKWEFDSTPEDSDQTAIGGGLGEANGILYLTTGFGEVVALKIADGSVLWRHSLLNPIRAAPTVDNGTVYVVTIDNQLSALNAKTGEVMWHHNGIAEPATLMGASNPAIEGENVIAAYSSGEIYALRSENGRVSWNYALTTPTQSGALPAIADIRGLPVISGGRVYAISHDGRMAAIDARTGDRAWEADVGGINTPVVAGDAIFVLGNDGVLMALSRDNGRVMWAATLQQRADPDDHNSDVVTWTGPILADGRLWLTNSLGQLASFSPDDGSRIGSADLDDPIYIPPVVANGVIYVVTDEGHLVALR